MITSLFLAKVIGIYFMVDALVAITRRKEVIPAFDEIKDRRVGLILFAIIVFIIGLLIVTAHNVWVGSAFQIVITVIGWDLVLKSLVILLMPHEFTVRIIEKFNHERFYLIGGSIGFLIGLWLAISGFIL
jgi:hypothetical protein